MNISKQWIWLIVVGVAVAAFAISFALGLRRTVPVEVNRQQLERNLPDAFSGKRVEVLNATRTSGLAREATQRLRDAGFDVVYFGTTGQAEQSEVLDRVGKRDIAEAVGKALGIARVTTALDSTRLVEASVILGPDWVPADRKKD